MADPGMCGPVLLGARPTGRSPTFAPRRSSREGTGRLYALEPRQPPEKADIPAYAGQIPRFLLPGPPPASSYRPKTPPRNLYREYRRKLRKMHVHRTAEVRVPFADSAPDDQRFLRFRKSLEQFYARRRAINHPETVDEPTRGAPAHLSDPEPGLIDFAERLVADEAERAQEPAVEGDLDAPATPSDSGHSQTEEASLLDELLHDGEFMRAVSRAKHRIDDALSPAAKDNANADNPFADVRAIRGGEGRSLDDGDVDLARTRIRLVYNIPELAEAESAYERYVRRHAQDLRAAPFLIPFTYRGRR